MPVGAFSDGQASATIVILYHTVNMKSASHRNYNIIIRGYCTVHACIMLVLATVKNACLYRITVYRMLTVNHT